MNDHEKSDAVVVPAKPGNKGTEARAEATADLVEGRTATKRNPTEGNTRRTRSRESVSSALGRVRQAAKQHPTMKFTAPLPPSTGEPRTQASAQKLEQPGC